MHKITVNITSCGRWNDLRRLIFSLSPHNLVIQVVLTQDVEVPEGLKKYIVGITSNAPTARNVLWKNTKSSLALFLDEDCELISPFYLQELRRLVMKANVPALAIGGNYESTLQQNILQKAYNFVTQIWTMKNSDPSILFLGGHFAIYQESIERQNLFDKEALFGGEEISLFQNLKLQKFVIQWRPALKVIHHPSPSLKHFFQRAWQHSKASAHPIALNKEYLRSLWQLIKTTRLHVVIISSTYLSLVYFFRLFFRASTTKVSINSEYFNPELLADRAKSSVGSKFGLALASRKNR